MKIEKTMKPASLTFITRNQTFRFGGVFLLLAGVLFFLLNWLPSGNIDPLNVYTARMTAMLVKLMGIDVVVREAFVSAGSFSIKVIPECTAIFVVILYFAFVMAYPASIRQKAMGLLFGIPVLVVVNMVRLVGIFLIGMHYRALFEYAHVYIGQIFMILLVLSISLIWLRWVVHVSTEDAPFGFIARFIAFSSIPFIFWLYIDEVYVFANLWPVRWVFGLFNVPLTIPETLGLYPYTFNTFHLIAYTALILATTSLDWRKKTKSLAMGLAILMAMHLLFRFHEALYYTSQKPYTMPPFVALIIINQWILPFLLWIAIVRKEIFKNGKKATPVCPLCGEEKTGLADHIRAKHGERALNDPQMKAALGDLHKET
ncbi:MAG: exosortase H [Thermodesulfobacteriota bacterium]|nr:exosortase H [Thermodesulfobacteriota bacterium]